MKVYNVDQRQGSTQEWRRWYVGSLKALRRFNWHERASSSYSYLHVTILFCMLLSMLGCLNTSKTLYLKDAFRIQHYLPLPSPTPQPSFTFVFLGNILQPKVHLRAWSHSCLSRFYLFRVNLRQRFCFDLSQSRSLVNDIQWRPL